MPRLLLAAPLLALAVWGVWPAPGDQLATLRGHAGPVRAVAFSADGTRMASAGDDGTVRLWDAATNAPAGVLTGQAGPVRAVAFGGATLASAGDDGKVRVWDAAVGRERFAVSVGKRALECVAVSPDGRHVAAAGADKAVTLVSAETGTVERKLTGHADHVHGVAFAPDGRTLVSGGEHGALRLWEAASGKLLATTAGTKAHLRALVVAPDGKSVLAASGRVRHWALPALKELPPLTEPASVRGVALRADGSRLATCHDDRTVRLWDAMTGAVLKELRGHRGIPTAVAFAPDGRTLATAGGDGAVMRWAAE